MRPLSEVACLDFSAGLDEPRLQALAEALGRYSPQLAIRPGQAVLLEIGRSRWLHQPATLAPRLLALGQKFGPARIGLGRHAGEALAAARYLGEPEAWPLEALGCYASPFSCDEAAAERALQLARALRDLGLATLADLLRLPPQSLGERFGPDAAILRQRVQGELGMAWPRFAPAQKLEEREPLGAPETLQGVIEWEALLFHLKRCVDRLCLRLRGRGLRCARLELGLSLQSRGRSPQPARLEIALALPQSGPRELLAILRERLAAWRLQGAPLELSLAVLETAPGLGSQVNFFTRDFDEAEAWNSLMTRLRQRLGPDQVYLAELAQRYLPEKTWKKVLREPGQAAPAPYAPRPGRPSRLLARPLELKREGEELRLRGHEQRPAWQAHQWQGPERLRGGRWGENFERDYFRVSVADGPGLWVFSQPGQAPGRYWLHGFFD